MEEEKHLEIQKKQEVTVDEPFIASNILGAPDKIHDMARTSILF